MPILGFIKWVGYFYVFIVLLGIFELAIMDDCYDLSSEVSAFTISMCLRNFGAYNWTVWFKLK